MIIIAVQQYIDNLTSFYLHSDYYCITIETCFTVCGVCMWYDWGF